MFGVFVIYNTKTLGSDKFNSLMGLSVSDMLKIRKKLGEDVVNIKVEDNFANITMYIKDDVVNSVNEILELCKGE